MPWANVLLSYSHTFQLLTATKNDKIKGAEKEVLVVLTCMGTWSLHRPKLKGDHVSLCGLRTRSWISLQRVCLTILKPWVSWWDCKSWKVCHWGLWAPSLKWLKKHFRHPHWSLWSLSLKLQPSKKYSQCHWKPDPVLYWFGQNISSSEMNLSEWICL